MADLILRCACGNIAEPRDSHVDALRCKSCWARFASPTQGADARPADKPHTYWTYCTPRDNDGPRFMIVFDDADRSPIILPDGNEEKARELFARLEMNWNCHLFELAKREPVGADARPAQSPGLDKFLFVPPNSEAESGWNAAIVHVTAHIQSIASDVTADARPVAIYQMRDHEEHDLWRDVDEVVYGGLIDEMRRIVYATRDAAPSDVRVAILEEAALACRARITGTRRTADAEAAACMNAIRAMYLPPEPPKKAEDWS